MANVNKKTKKEDVQLHIKQSFEFIDEYLPLRYVSLTQAKMQLLGNVAAASGTIRNVRSKKGVKPYQNLPVITALLEVAKDFQIAAEGFINVSTQISE